MIVSWKCSIRFNCVNIGWKFLWCTLFLAGTVWCSYLSLIPRPTNYKQIKNPFRLLWRIWFVILFVTHPITTFTLHRFWFTVISVRVMKSSYPQIHSETLLFCNQNTLAILSVFGLELIYFGVSIIFSKFELKMILTGYAFGSLMLYIRDAWSRKKAIELIQSKGHSSAIIFMAINVSLFCFGFAQ